jgi:PAS domain-containing protein
MFNEEALPILQVAASGDFPESDRTFDDLPAANKEIDRLRQRVRRAEGQARSELVRHHLMQTRYEKAWQERQAAIEQFQRQGALVQKIQLLVITQRLERCTVVLHDAVGELTTAVEAHPSADTTRVEEALQEHMDDMRQLFEGMNQWVEGISHLIELVNQKATTFRSE